MRTLIIMLAVAGVAAGQSPTKSKLQLEMELSRIKAARRTVAATPSAYTSYADAYAACKASGKPLFATVGLDCSALCAKLRNEFVTAHLPEWEGSSRTRSVLLIPSAGEVFKVREWPTIPSDADVKAAADEWRTKLRPSHLPAVEGQAKPVAADWSRAT